MHNILIWVVMFAIAECALLFFQLKMRRSPVGKVYITVFVIKAFSLLFLPFLVMAVDVFRAWVFGGPMAVLYIALCGDVVSDIIRFIAERVQNGHGGERKAVSSRMLVYLIIIGIAVSTVYFICGTYNMQNISANEHVYESEKLEEEHRFVFVSDIHTGASQNISITKAMFDEISVCDPEFVILGGDITDEYTKKEEMEIIYEIIGTLDVPVYFVYGNHDRQPNSDLAFGRTYSVQELEDVMAKNGITVLDDEYIKVSDDIMLLGRDDAASESRMDATLLENPDQNCFLITADHNPYQDEDIIIQKADLQLSAHTHAGQIAPNYLLYSLAGLNVYGDFTVGDTALYVSSGAGGWKVPFRTEVRGEYEIITLKPVKL